MDLGLIIMTRGIKLKLRKLEHNYMTSRNEVTQIMQIMRELCKYTWREVKKHFVMMSE